MPCKKGSANCQLTNPSDTYGVLAGYDAGIGYDLASGLGSVDVTNLVNSGGFVNNGNAADLTISSPNPVLTISAPATSATMTLTLASVAGFTGTFNLTANSCSAMLPATTCWFNPASVTINPANASATTILTVITTGTSAASHTPSIGRAERAIAGSAALFGLSA